MNSLELKANRLINEQSPYLLMHAHNPVDWYPWGEEAFARAQSENKLIVVSIGYAACHWCHVMEHESFSDVSVAQLMNEHFISIKVDREERPDIDSIYMEAVQILSGRGGWPLNAIVLPNGKPIYAATYFPRENWMSILQQIQYLYETNSEQLIHQADEISASIRQLSTRFINQRDNNQTKDSIEKSYQNLINAIDFRNGGLNSAPKFPMPVVFEYLLHYYHFSGNLNALNAVTFTLDKMAIGGIYDQVGGGFARYSTDNYWKVPHFEKMLYDNAQLVSLYSNAYKLTHNEQYAQVIIETLTFIEQEMTSTEFGFYSAIDADSDGDEGKYYVWDYNELKNILNENEYFILEYFSTERNGNWEPEVNILFRTKSDDAFAQQLGISTIELGNKLANVKEKLLKYRNKRVKPLTDTKIIASWNALMIIGYLEAYAALGNNGYLTMAINNAQFIIQKLLEGNNLYRNYKDGKTYTQAKLDDYANVIHAFINLYKATFNEMWLDYANNLTEHVLNHFHDAQTGMFFYTSDLDEKLIARQFEIPDQVIPSSNSVMAMNLFNLGTIFEKNEYLLISKKMLSNVSENLAESTAYFANWARLQLLITESPFEVAIVGEKCLDIKNELNKNYIPIAIITGCTNNSNLPMLQHKFIENQTNVFICKDKVCQLPTSDIDEVIRGLNRNLNNSK
jgi:uncharacterized protein YyaL (SSP411 family)